MAKIKLKAKAKILTAKQKAEGFKIGLDVAKDLTEPDPKERV